MRNEAKGLGSAEFQRQSQPTRSPEHKWHYGVGLLEAETRNSGFCINIGPYSSHSLALHSLEVGKNLLGIHIYNQGQFSEAYMSCLQLT